MDRTSERVEADLIKEIEKCHFIYDNLKDNAAYKALVDDFKQAAQEIDSVWHLQPDVNKLQEMRITKFAAQTLIGALDSYKYSLDKSKEQLERLREDV